MLIDLFHVLHLGWHHIIIYKVMLTGVQIRGSEMMTLQARGFSSSQLPSLDAEKGTRALCKSRKFS